MKDAVIMSAPCFVTRITISHDVTHEQQYLRKLSELIWIALHY